MSNTREIIIQNAIDQWINRTLPIIYADTMSKDKLTVKIIEHINNQLLALKKFTADNAAEELELLELIEKLFASIADEYSAESTYSINDFVFYANNLYKCIATISTAEEWNAEHWQLVNTADEITNLLTGKLDKPSVAGTSGQVLTSNGSGGQVWATIGTGEIVVDNTLTVAGAAADAKATGDEITAIKTDNSELGMVVSTFVTDNYDGKGLIVVASTADRAINDTGGIVYAAGNTVKEYSVTPGDSIMLKVAGRSTETYKKTYAFYNGEASSAHLVGSVYSDALDGKVMIVPSGVTRLGVSQLTSNTTNYAKKLTAILPELQEDIFSSTKKYTKTDGSGLTNSIIKSNYYCTKNGTTQIQLKPLSGYKSFIYPVTEDTYFYCDTATSLFRICTIKNGTLAESSGTYTVTGTNSQEISSGSLPTENSKILLNAGDYIMVTAPNSGVLSINMPMDTLSNELLLNDRQIDQIQASGVTEKHPSCVYETNNLKIYIPTGKGYIRYDFTHNTDQSINADVWRVNNAYSVGNDYSELSQLTTSGEWECALHLQDRDDFSGGIAHGDEMVQEITFLLDGKKVSTSDLATQTTFTELRIVELSYMYDPDDHTTKICNHGSEHIFNADGLTINQNIIWAGSFPATTCYLAMFPPKKNGDDKVYMDTNYALETLPTSNYRNTYDGAKSVGIFSDTADYCAVFEVTKYVDLTGGNVLWILDNGGQNYHKMYYVVTTGASVTNGETWKTQTKYKIDVGN